MIKISAKDLGAIAMPDFCPRCFWIKRNAKIPWQIFPGIFSSIDSYSKKIVHHYFDTFGGPPAWMPEIADAVKYLKAPHWSKYFRVHEETGITISGAVDDLFECDDKSRIIVDYKTSKYTENQDKLKPMYDIQLNAYAWIEEGFESVVRGDLPLVYCEPVTEPNNDKYLQDGFNMSFTVKSVIIKKDFRQLFEVLKTAKSILSGKIPHGSDGCKDCDSLNQIIGLVK